MTGHNNIKKYFENAVKNGMLAHAYLFYGPEGLGKKSFAVDLFRLINGRDAEGDPDFKLITPRVEEEDPPAGRHGTKIYIRDIRELKSYLSLKPYYGPYKIVVVNDADRLETEASNAFLKMLEEPSPSTIIILITSKPKLVLPTVLSRCEKISFFSSAKKEPDKETIKAIGEFIKVRKEGIAERMVYADKIYKKEDYQKLFAGLIHWFYNEEEKDTKILKGLLELNNIISQPQYNHRLAIENFLINL